MSEQTVREKNRESDLYFDGGQYTCNRVVMIPKGWEGEFVEPGGLDEVYGYVGNPDVLKFKTREGRVYETTDACAWTPVERLNEMRQIDEAEARRLDPDLFELLDSIGDGRAA